MSKRFKNDKGFTLVELMVVILIIGILIAIAIPVFNAATSNARERTCQASMRTVESAIMTYDAANPEAPINMDATGAAGWDAAMALLAPADPAAEEFLRAEPVCPEAGDYSFVAGTVTCSIHGAVQD